MKNEYIIKELLHIIDAYNNDGIFKEKTLTVSSIDPDEICIIKLITKGVINQNTPFYSASADTCIIAEYYNKSELVWAEVLFSTKDLSEV